MKKGWEIKRLPDIAEYFIGLTYAPKDVGNAGTIVLRSSNVQNDQLDLSDLVRVTCPVKKPLHVRKGDILMCSRNGSKRLVGKTAVIGNLPEEMTFGTFMTVIRSERNPYLSWFFRSETFRDQIGVGENTMINQITKYMLDAIRVPVPPLPEQQRIVGILDEAFEGLATAKANAEKNLLNARAIFDSHLQAVFSQRGKGWVEKSLGDTCEMYQPKTIGTKDLVADGPYPVFGANGVIGRYDKFNHEEPQLLITCRGATCGSVNISEPKSWVTGNAMVVRPKDHALDLHFLEFVFRGGINISAAITGAAQPQITRTNLSPLLICYPISASKQKRLAEQFEELTEETQRLAAIYQRKLTALEALKKSLLHQAFTGNI